MLTFFSAHRQRSKISLLAMRPESTPRIWGGSMEVCGSRIPSGAASAYDPLRIGR